MFDYLSDFCRRPAPFSRYTAKELWTMPHLSEQMLSYHLSQATDLASRRIETIDRTVRWIDAQVKLNGKQLCDLGCGPGLYAQGFHALGAGVTGIDFSERAINYATDHSDSTIRYLHADYLTDALPTGFDVTTLIYMDFCVLSPEQRSVLLYKIRQMLNPGGQLVLDVAGMGMYDSREEVSAVESNLMGGFWSAGDYIGMQKTFIYEERSLVLDRYAIVEPCSTWEIYNWFQHYSPKSILEELERHGFTVTQMTGGLAGENLDDRSELIGIVAEAR